MGPCNFTNNNLHNYSSKIFIANLFSFSQSNPRQLLNKLYFTEKYFTGCVISSTVSFKPLGSNKKLSSFSNNKDNRLKIPTTASNRVYI